MDHSVHRSRVRKKSFSKQRNQIGLFFTWLWYSVNFFNVNLAIKNEFLTIDKLCDGSHSGFLSSLPRPVDGAVLTSDNERDVDCVITFQTESILERFMLRFERLSIDCNDRLILYDGAHAIGNHRANLSCDATEASFGRGGYFYTDTNFVTLKYRTDSWGTKEHGFKLIITAFKGAEKNGCRLGFLCDTKICIDNDLVCDNVDHCGDSSDERHSQFCSLKLQGSLFSAIMSTGRICPCHLKQKQEDETILNSFSTDNTAITFPTWMGTDTTTTVSIVLAALLLATASTIACWIVRWRKRESRANQRIRIQLPPSVGLQMTKTPNGCLFTPNQMAPTAQGSNDASGIRSNAGSVGSLGMGNMNLESQMYTSTSLMATGNTHHIFDSTPPIQDDPFQQSSSALTSMIDNQGNENHPVERGLKRKTEKSPRIGTFNFARQMNKNIVPNILI